MWILPQAAQDCSVKTVFLPNGTLFPTDERGLRGVVDLQSPQGKHPGIHDHVREFAPAHLSEDIDLTLLGFFDDTDGSLRLVKIIER